MKGTQLERRFGDLTWETEVSGTSKSIQEEIFTRDTLITDFWDS